MIGKKINQLATELAPVSTDLTIIGDPISGVSKKITLAQLGAIFSGAVSFYDDLASFPATGDINVIYCAKDTKKLYLWSGSAYVEVFPSQALLDTYQLRSEKGNANGYASLDSSGKVPISQLPSSIMEYKGTWSAATNTPTLANGTGDTGDVYLCNAAGTVNFGAGPLTFAVGDYVVYSGSIWQRSSGAVGTVTSVAATITGDAIGITGSPVTTSGTLALAFAGTSSQYINGAGNLTTFPTLTGYVPYTGATANVDLGTYDLTADFITASRGSYTSSGGGNTLEISHTSGSGIALNITKGGNGEGLYINKTSGSGNAATIVGTLEATTLVKTGGTSSQFLKADGSVDSSTYLTTSVAATTYLPMVLSSTANSIEINGQFFDVASAANSYTSGRLIIAPTYGAIGYQNAGVFDGLKILTNGNAEFSNSGITRFFNQVRFDSTLTNGTYTYTLPSATGTLALTSDLTGGTVTSVGLSSATSGVTIGSTPITTSGTITLAIATASGSQQGLLSSTDWTTFNNKQSALTNPVTGTGTTNYLPKFTGTSTIGNSIVQDNSTHIDIGGYALFTRAGKQTIINPNVGASNVVADFGVGSGMGLTFTTDVERMRLTASGNLGLGVTPSAWNSIYKVAEVGTAAIFGTSAYNSAAFTTNVFYNAANSPRYIANDFSTMYWQDDGKHLWYIAPSGTAGNAISFTQAMTLDASGRLGIGTTSPLQRLHVYNNSSSTAAIFQGSSNSYIQLGTSSESYIGNVSGALLFETGGSTRLTIASTGAATFSSSVTALGSFTSYGGFNGYASSTQNLLIDWSSESQVTTLTATNLFFGTNAQRRMTITSGGNVGIGTTSITSATNQIVTEIYATSYGTLRLSAAGSVKAEFTANNQSNWLYTGTTTNHPYVFATNETERMRLTASGELCVGTTSAYGAGFLVNVQGNIYASAAIVAGSSVTAGGRIISATGAFRTGGFYIPYSGASTASRTWAMTNDEVAFGDFSIIQSTTQTGDVNLYRLYISPSGNVGIGTTSPNGNAATNNLLHINGSTSNAEIHLTNSSTGSTATDGLTILQYGTQSVLFNLENDAMLFGTNNTERMRITSAGTVGINTTYSNSVYKLVTKVGTDLNIAFGLQGTSASIEVFNDAVNTSKPLSIYGAPIYLPSTTGDTTGSAANMFIDGTTGRLQRSTSSLKYKNNIRDYDKGLDIIKQMRPVYYNGKNDGNTLFAGLIAEEVHALGLTEFVQYAKDGSPDSLSYQNMVALLIKGIKELKAELDTLKNK